jgi:hypothetical protein
MKTKIPWYKKWNPLWWFDNLDDPMPAENLHIWLDYKPWVRWFLWRLRNPMHNFMFYVIGVADREYIVTGDFPDKNWNPNGGWNRLKLIGDGWTRSFASYRGAKWEFYYGWNKGGRLGFAFRRAYA